MSECWEEIREKCTYSRKAFGMGPYCMKLPPFRLHRQSGFRHSKCEERVCPLVQKDEVV